MHCSWQHHARVSIIVIHWNPIHRVCQAGGKARHVPFSSKIAAARQAAAKRSGDRQLAFEQRMPPVVRFSTAAFACKPRAPLAPAALNFEPFARAS